MKRYKVSRKPNSSSSGIHWYLDAPGVAIVRQLNDDCVIADLTDEGRAWLEAYFEHFTVEACPEVT